jgi:hypothetical protein
MLDSEKAAAAAATELTPLAAGMRSSNAEQEV